MTNDDDINVPEEDDINMPEDFENELVEKTSLKEIWENNPMLKLATIVLGGVIIFGVYITFFSGEEVDKSKVVFRGVSTSDVTHVPGQEVLDPAYKAALEEKNRKEAEDAVRTGKSALPMPTSPTKIGGIEVPEMPMMPDGLKTDVLSEWRKAAEAKRIRAAQEAIEEENGMLNPEGVPLVQPIRPQRKIGMGVNDVSKQLDEKSMKRITEQMRVIVAAQEPMKGFISSVTEANSLYVLQKREEKRIKKQKNAGAKEGGGFDRDSKGKKKTGKVIVPSGAIAYAQLLTEVNSDIEGPVLAHVLSGPFAGARIIGEAKVKSNYIVLSFSRIVKDTVSYKMDGIALDENTTLAGQATDINHHYFIRVILPAAAAFVEGYGSALAETGTTVTQIAGGGQATEQPKPDSEESLYAGLREASESVSDMLDEGSSRPITIKIAKGTTMGIFFIDSVTTKDVEK